MTHHVTREELVMRTLLAQGAITEAKGQAEYGRMHVGSAIWRIRNKKQHLIPAGKQIVSVRKRDTNGRPYVEWQLREVA